MKPPCGAGHLKGTGKFSYSSSRIKQKCEEKEERKIAPLKENSPKRGGTVPSAPPPIVKTGDPWKEKIRVILKVGQDEIAKDRLI